MCIFFNLINLYPLLYDFLSSVFFGSIRCSFSDLGSRLTDFLRSLFLRCIESDEFSFMSMALVTPQNLTCRMKVKAQFCFHVFSNI